MESGRPHRSRTSTCLLAGGLVALVLVLWGGYGHHWPWTGINGRTATLWDWLHLLLLPLAVAVLPIWLARDAKLDPAIKRPAIVSLGLFAVIVLAGYLIPWAWTGFVGNSLWDWLNLVALPVAVALTPLAIAAAAGVIFGAIVLGGYLGRWKWTGFTGNTLWDWMHLLLLPLLLPIVVVPALVPMAKARMTAIEVEQAAQAAAEADAAARSADDDALARSADDDALARSADDDAVVTPVESDPARQRVDADARPERR
jgi:hypothetical protein